MRGTGLFLFCFGITVLPLQAGDELAHPASEGQAAKEIREAQKQRFAAMVAGDREALRRILADDLTYTHTNGWEETKAAFLSTLASGGLAYLSIQPEDVNVRVYGPVGVVTGRSEMRVRSGDRELSFAIRFLEVHAKQDGGWKLVAWQSTRLPEDQ